MFFKVVYTVWSTEVGGTNICRGLDNNITSAVLQNIGLVNKIRL